MIKIDSLCNVILKHTCQFVRQILAPYFVNMFVCCYLGVGKAWTELGKVYFEQDFRIKALEAFEQSYRIHKEFYGEQDHPDVSLD